MFVWDCLAGQQLSGEGLELDADGFPALFGQVLSRANSCASMASSAAPSSAGQVLSRANSRTSIASSAAPSSVGSLKTLMYDSEGFPIVDDEELGTVTPVRGKRKRLVKSAKKEQKASKHGEKEVAKSPAAKSAATEAIVGIQLSGPTRELNPRMELCGTVNNKRVHVFTLTKQRHGDHFMVVARGVARELAKGGYTKQEACKLKDDVLSEVECLLARDARR